MTAPLSQDLRKRLFQAVEEGASAREAAARFAVSASAAIKLVRRVRQTGSTALAKIGGYRKPLLAGQEAFLRKPSAKKRPPAERDGLQVRVRNQNCRVCMSQLGCPLNATFTELVRDYSAYPK